MAAYLESWYQNLLTQTSGAFDREGEAWGECNKHMGPSFRHAKVKLRLSPSNDMEVQSQVDPETSDNLRRNGYNDYIVFGVLDVMLTHSVAPYRLFKLTILAAEIDAVESTQLAFRLAARDAAAKILANLS